MEWVRLFFRRITDDFKQKELLPLKLLFFVHASTLFVLYPYLTIHMRELGINVEETAIMSAVTPVISIVMPPLAGMVADKIGNFRLLLALSSVLGGVSALLLLAVPVGRLTVTFPPRTELLATCGARRLALHTMQDYGCEPLHPFAYDVNISVLSCGFVCSTDELSADDRSSLLRAASYDVRVSSPLYAQRVLYRHSLSPRPARPDRRDQSAARVLANNPLFHTSVAALADGRVFFPTPHLYALSCGADDGSCFFGSERLMNASDKAEAVTEYKARVSHEGGGGGGDGEGGGGDGEGGGGDGGGGGGDGEGGGGDSFLVKAIARLNASLEDESDEGVDDTCTDFFQGTSVAVEAGAARLARCAAGCAALAPRRALCSNLQQQLELDPRFTFWAYLAVRVFIGIIGGTAFAMFEGAVIAIVRSQRADYGLQRLYGSVGGMISSPLSGLLIDYVSRGKGYTDFRPAFYLYAVLKVLGGALMLAIDLQFKPPATDLLRDVAGVLRNVELVALFIACFILGTAWGYIESFLFWLLQDLGASRSLMGVTITVGGVAGLPLLVLSGPIIRRIGHANVLFIGFVFYAIRLLGYSLIYNPWLCLVFEALESVTSSLAFTAAVTYAARLSTVSTDTSVQGLLGGLYYGVGKGSGSLIGGYLMKAFGTRQTYQIFAAFTLLTGCIYFLFNKFFLRKRYKHADDDWQKEKPALDVEGRESRDADKPRPLDAAKADDSKVDKDKLSPALPAAAAPAPAAAAAVRPATDSDSGVDNLAYTESEPSDTKKDDEKDN